MLREVSTGSWLGLEHHGQGIGTEMRAAVLYLAFAGLGAEHAVSSAFIDNPASLWVSRKLGYANDGIERQVSRGQPAVIQRLRLDRDTWQATQKVPVTIHGLQPCLHMFGISASPGCDYTCGVAVVKMVISMCARDKQRSTLYEGSTKNAA